MHRCEVTRRTHRAWARYFYTKTHSRSAAWTRWRKHEVTQCRKGIASGHVPQSISLLAVNAVQRTVPDSRTYCRSCHGIANDWPLLFWMPKSSRKAQELSRSQVLCSHAGAEHKPQTATSEHSSRNIKKPKLENSKEKCHIINYSLIRTCKIST